MIAMIALWSPQPVRTLGLGMLLRREEHGPGAAPPHALLEGITWWSSGHSCESSYATVVGLQPLVAPAALFASIRVQRARELHQR